MTTLSPVAGAAGPSANAPAKGGTSEPGFRAAFDNAAANLPSPSEGVQPSRSDKGRKPTDKEDSTSTAKQSKPSQGPDGPLTLLIAPPAPGPAELPSYSLPMQEPASTPAAANAGSVDRGPAALTEAAPDGASGVPAVSAADAPITAVDSKDTAGKPSLVPPGSAASQPPQAEAKIEPLSAQGPPTPSAKNAAQQADALAMLQPVDPSSTPASAGPQLSAGASIIPTQPQAATIPSLAGAAAQPLPRAAALAEAGAGVAARPGSSKPSVQSAPGPQKTEPATHQPTSAPTKGHDNQEGAKSESSLTKKDSGGSLTPATPVPAQAFAASISAGASTSVLSGAASVTTAGHETPSELSLAGTLPTSQSGAMHLPDSNAANPALPQINTARVLGSMAGTELRVGMHSQEFGSVSIATSVSPGGVAAQIALDHAELGKALAAHLPGIEEKLGHALGVQARVEVLGTGTGVGSGGSAPREGSGGRTDRSFTSNSAGASTTRDPYRTQAPPEALEQAGSGLRLSVRA